ncbi:hypothetical protein BU24DRAFT_477883 [Aaosphaeria arxii CBS 175.79]|uniref:Uncharacterized protein n=1 Tax=Aaosphaeria arxii CBS 175.79 TaxID=1450172 RepID=A0A6A5XU62_9PLEO|nr:uncharacterized protein BU24DRAFT_477883 [Aaosphaeria arxii CBS 175.79]KAF2016895.1 hypothetical protein BU24DRAFT_477883 [Aaosphaeria arxii CBS 175.79]
MPPSQVSSKRTHNIDTRVPYRTGWPILPVLPVQETPAVMRHHFHHPDLIMTTIFRILDECRLHERTIGLCYRLNKGVSRNRQRPTMRIACSVESDREDTRIEAVMAIKSLFEQENAEVAVEIIRYDAYVGFPTFPILSEDYLILIWNSLFPTLVNEIEPDRDWVSLDLVRRGEEKQPTVLISARDANDPSWWNTKLPMLRRIIPVDIALELRFADPVHPICNEDSTAKAVSVMDYPIVSMGQSCGSQGQTGAGTLGGFMELERDGEALGLFGLTNHHVLCGDLDHSLPGESPVVSPADIDHEKTERMLENSVNSTLQIIGDHVETTQYNPSKMRALELLRNQVSRTQGDQNTVANFDRKLGHVFTSQLTTAPNEKFNQRYQHLFGPESFHENLPWALDWCLVQLDKARIYINSVRTPVENGVRLQTGAPAIEYCKMDPTKSYKVVKYGRTSGWTIGVVSAVRSVIKLYTNTTATHERWSGGWSGRWSLCHHVVGHKGRPFLEPGDSGAMVLLDQGGKTNAQIVGIGLSSNEDISYMSPIDLVIYEIEKKTAANVTVPTFAGVAPESTD